MRKLSLLSLTYAVESVVCAVKQDAMVKSPKLQNYVGEEYTPQYTSHPLFNGQCLYNDFEQLENLGKGISSSVIKVRHQPTGKLAVFKTFTPFHINHHLDFIRNEEWILHELEHPKIVNHYCTIARYPEREVIFVMELIEGQPLVDFVEDSGQRLSVERIVEVLAQLLAITRYLHHHQVTHRDIKEGNIILTPDGNIKLIDFGLATIDSNNGLVKSFGAKGFGAPEKLCSFAKYGRSADYFSIGILGYVLATGQFPDFLTYYRQLWGGSSIMLPKTGHDNLDLLLVVLTNPNGSHRWSTCYENWDTIKSFSLFVNISWPEEYP